MYYKIITQLKQDTDYKNNSMITINLNLNIVKETLKLAMLAGLTYLLFNITSNYNITIVKFEPEDTIQRDVPRMFK